MDKQLFNRLMKKRSRPSQFRPEWMMCLEVCESYLKERNIKNPIVVELGVKGNKQKSFWEQFFGAHHIGIDYSTRRGTPDILGNTHDPKTIEMLQNKLKGRLINILFIDAAHSYEDVKKDFEIYSPLCRDIIIIHDIETFRYREHEGREVWKFWDELKYKAHKGIEEYQDFFFISMYQYRKIPFQMGTGIIIKR